MNPRTLRDLHEPLTSPLDATPLDDTPINATPIDTDQIHAADLIARFRDSGLLSDVSRRTEGPAPTGSVNTPAPLSLRKQTVLDKAVAPKSAAPLGPAAGPTANHALDPNGTVRVADLLNRHPDLTARAPRTGHRAVPPRPTTRARTLSALRPAPSITVALRPALTVAAIIGAVALVEAPNLLSTSHAATGSRAGRSPATTSTETTVNGADTILAGDLPRHAGPVSTATTGRVSRSTRRAISAAAPHGAASPAPAHPLPANHVPLLKPGQTVPGTWIRPSSGRYTSCFCSRWGSFHAGIDLANKLGTPILAVGDGTVIKAGPASGFGHWVVIQHSNGDVSIYGHMKYFFVHVGQKVKAGEKIAVVGDQGFSTGPHLHFEVHKGGLGGKKINPIPWLKARGIVIGPLSKDG